MVVLKHWIPANCRALKNLEGPLPENITAAAISKWPTAMVPEDGWLDQVVVSQQMSHWSRHRKRAPVTDFSICSSLLHLGQIFKSLSSSLSNTTNFLSWFSNSAWSDSSKSLSSSDGDHVSSVSRVSSLTLSSPISLKKLSKALPFDFGILSLTVFVSFGTSFFQSVWVPIVASLVFVWVSLDGFTWWNK